MQEDTLVEFVSAFNMNRCIGSAYQVNLVKSLDTLYGTNFRHLVTEIVEEGWGRFSIKILYSAKFGCTKEDLVKEFQNIWPAFNQLWPQYSTDKKQFIKHILDNYILSHPKLCQLNIVCCSPIHLLPLEQSYSQLAKICFKDRNSLMSEHLETLYILGVLKNSVIGFTRAREILEI